MKQDKVGCDQSLEADISKIEAHLETDDSSQVASYLDHSILLAAEREIKQPPVTKIYQFSWFRKLSLPLYAATSIAFTVFAITHLWQPPQYPVATDKGQKTEVKISQSVLSKAPSVAVKKRVEREMPQLILPPSDGLDLPVESDPKRLSEKSQPVLDQIEATQSIFTGSQMVVKDYSEKQAWVEKIVSHMKAGQLQIARNEIVAFKKVYPEYPIEEQIKLFMP